MPSSVVLPLPAPNRSLVSGEGLPKNRHSLPLCAQGSRGFKVSVDLSQILASGAPIEEIVMGHPYEQCRSSNLSFLFSLVAPPTNLTVVDLYSALLNLASVSRSPAIISPSSSIMYISLLPISLLVSLAAAATTISGSTGSSSACAAQPVMDACYASTSAIAEGCLSTDYGCLCSKWNDVLTYAPLFPFLTPS